jgi:hypothetical protein
VERGKFLERMLKRERKRECEVYLVLGDGKRTIIVSNFSPLISCSLDADRDVHIIELDS